LGKIVPDQLCDGSGYRHRSRIPVWNELVSLFKVCRGYFRGAAGKSKPYLAFFLESTFLGLWIFGWDKLSKGLHLTTIWLVAIGSNLSALWILIANSFMQERWGNAIQNGRALMTDFDALLSNPMYGYSFPYHDVRFYYRSIFCDGISAYTCCAKRQPEIFQRSFQISAIMGLFPMYTGNLGRSQPGSQHGPVTTHENAAAEALWESQDPASMSLITIGDEPELKDVFAIRIPRLLSLLAYNGLTGESQGNQEPASSTPGYADRKNVLF